MATKIIKGAFLLRCPFCGSSAQLKQGKTTFVECTKEGCGAVKWGRGIVNAAKTWNRRA